jgi:aspartyl-tRNA(Asn)/glutamyl-tRNA(Gln) amidotransferase subunit C
MKIDEKTIRHLETLARIELTAEERERLAGQLDKIVGYCEELQKVDTEGIEPTSAVVLEGHSALRPDEAKPGLDRDVVLTEAPDPKKPFFRVPKVIER